MLKSEYHALSQIRDAKQTPSKLGHPQIIANYFLIKTPSKLGHPSFRTQLLHYVGRELFMAENPH